MNAIAIQDPYIIPQKDRGSQLQKVEQKIGHVQAVRVGKTLYISGSVRWNHTNNTSTGAGSVSPHSLDNSAKIAARSSSS